MNRSNIHTRLLEIRKASRTALDALAQDDDRQLGLSIDLVEINLQAIRAEVAEAKRAEWLAEWETNLRKPEVRR